MSEKIKITIVFENEKLNNRLDDLKGQSVILTHDPSMPIMSTLLKNNLVGGSFCGGRGDCGRCKIQFLKDATIPTVLERSTIGPKELRQGYRLACLAKPKNDCTIRLALVDAPNIAILTNMIDVTENTNQLSQHNLQTEKQKPNVMESIIAVDLGTTTIAMQLVEMDSGRVVDTYCEMNPQRRYGADVLSRIQASCEGNRETLQRLAVEALERGVERFIHRNAAIRCMCIAGNTTMEHLLMGYDVSSLGSTPFKPVEIGLQEYRHPAWDFKVWLTPGISAFVGGDIVAGLYACGMLINHLPEQFTGQQENVHQGKTSLLIDLGTNGEMAIADGTRMIVTATAAGPAFEGGASAGIVGSDMIACAALLLRRGILDETGLLAEPYFTEGISLQSSLYMTQKDIRSLQMAKAAVRAGVEVLLKRLGEQWAGESLKEGARLGSQPIERVYLAGGFGYYLDVDAAFRIGLLPAHMRGQVRAVGNSSLTGAYQIGRDLWRHKIDRRMLEESLSFIESINLAEQEEFEKLYIRHMDFLPDAR